MTQPKTDNPHTRVARAAVLAGALGAIAVGAAFGLAKLAGAELLAQDIAMAGGLLLLAGLPGLVGAAVAAGRMRGGAVYGFLGGMLFRMPAGAALAIWGPGAGLAQSNHFSMCIAGAYLMLLVIEVLVLAPAVKATAALEPNPPKLDPVGVATMPAQTLALPKESV